MPTCPFCGLPSESPHTQEGCLNALSAEIVRMRAILQQIRSAVVPTPANADPD